MSLVVRCAGDPAAISSQLPHALEGLDPDVVIAGIWTMDDIIEGYFPAPFAAAFAALGLLAVLLSAVGLYAVVAFQIARRTREFGIRIALGADGWRLRRQIVGEGVRLSAAAVLPGLAAGAGLGLLLSAQLETVKPVDWLVTVIVTSLLLAVSAAACLIPGRRATRVPPAVALRCD